MDEPAAEGATRVRFRERQVLRAADLAAEQDYRVSMRRRHNTGQHVWGIVRGLGLKKTVAGGLSAEPDGLSVEPGMAVDGYGRELFVEEPLVIPPDAFDRLGSESLDVWLVYDYEGATTTQRGRRACGPGSYDRRREVSRLRLTRVRPADLVNQAQVVDPRVPAEVPTADLGFGPHRSPPDDAARAWPVYLGRVSRVSTCGGARYEIPPAPRPYAGLRGEMLTAASGRARVQVGGEAAGDARRFAVSVADAAGAFVERLALDREGKTFVRGNATLGGRLVLHENRAAGVPNPHELPHELPPECSRGTTRRKVEGTARAINFRALAATPKAAAPWQVYRTSVARDGKSVRQLRFEIGNPGDKGDPALYRLTVGADDATGKFAECLSVSADCLVKVAGNLKVCGQVIEAPIKADPSDPRFGQELINQFTKAAEEMGADVGGGGAGATPELQVAFVELFGQEGDDPPYRIDGAGPIGVGHKLLYTVGVMNGGKSLITSLQIYESLTYEGVTTRRTYPQPPFSLHGGEPREFPQKFEPGALPGDIKIAVTVIGVGALSNVLSATAETTISVVGPGW